MENQRYKDSNRFLLIGLGNIGEEYKTTRHNIGFLIIEYLANKYNISLKKNRYVNLAQTRLKSKTLFLIQPTTFMNLSGKAVSYWLKALKIPLSHSITIVDDTALCFGSIRLREKGSDGGHNGLKDISLCLKTNEFPRLRIGIGSDFFYGKKIDHVLGNFSAEEKNKLVKIYEYSELVLHTFVLQSLKEAMKHNSKKIFTS